MRFNQRRNLRLRLRLQLAPRLCVVLPLRFQLRLRFRLQSLKGLCLALFLCGPLDPGLANRLLQFLDPRRSLPISHKEDNVGRNGHWHETLGQAEHPEDGSRNGGAREEEVQFTAASFSSWRWSICMNMLLSFMISRFRSCVLLARSATCARTQPWKALRRVGHGIQERRRTRQVAWAKHAPGASLPHCN